MDRIDRSFTLSVHCKLLKRVVARQLVNCLRCNQLQSLQSELSVKPLTLCVVYRRPCRLRHPPHRQPSLNSSSGTTCHFIRVRLIRDSCHPVDVDVLVSRLSASIDEIAYWMSSNRLQTNVYKAGLMLMWCHTPCHVCQPASLS